MNKLTIIKLSLLFKISSLALLMTLVFSCNQRHDLAANTQIQSVKDSVKKLVNNTVRDLATKGPIVWLNYFENTPDFFMVSDGTMAFPNYKAADTFIKRTLIKQFSTINLKFANMHIDVLSVQYATIGADVYEDLRDFSGKVISYDGYFTATVHQTAKGWKYRNMHWSVKKN
jgi:hypothetical protein